MTITYPDCPSHAWRTSQGHCGINDYIRDSSSKLPGSCLSVQRPLFPYSLDSSSSVAPLLFSVKDASNCLLPVRPSMHSQGTCCQAQQWAFQQSLCLFQDDVQNENFAPFLSIQWGLWKFQTDMLILQNSSILTQTKWHHIPTKISFLEPLTLYKYNY